MATTAFGPQGPNYTTTRPPADPKASNGADTFFKNCSAAGAKDGTFATADFFNVLVSNLRYLARYAPVSLDDADDTMIYRAVKQMISGTTSTILGANLTLWVNPALGSDANDGSANTANNALATIQRAIVITFGYLAGAYTITIRLADGLYTTGFKTPVRPGPTFSIIGNLTTPSNVQISPPSGVVCQINGPNIVTISGVRPTTSTALGGYHLFVSNSGSTLYVNNVECGAAGGACFASAAGAVYVDGAIKITGSCLAVLQAGYFGNILVGSITPCAFNIVGAITVSLATASAGDGAIQCPSANATWNTGSGSITGTRYFAALNGIIVTNGSGASYFPGTVAGSVITGGQYN